MQVCEKCNKCIFSLQNCMDQHSATLVWGLCCLFLHTLSPPPRRMKAREEHAAQIPTASCARTEPTAKSVDGTERDLNMRKIIRHGSKYKAFYSQGMSEG